MSQENTVAAADDPSEKDGEATLYNETNNDNGSLKDLQVRLDHVESYQRQYVEEFLEKQLAGRVEALEAEVAEHRRKLESVVGLAEGEQTSPQKRAVDLALVLIRRAENRVDEDRYAMWYQQVVDALAQAGHGPPVHKQWAFDAMDHVAGGRGFGTTQITNRHGREVKAVTVDLAELPDHEPSAVGNDIITSRGEKAAQSSRVKPGGVISDE